MRRVWEDRRPGNAARRTAASSKPDPKVERERELKELQKNLLFVEESELDKMFSEHDVDDDENGESEQLKKISKPIDKEMDVPLGVFVVLKPTYIIDANNMFLRCENETKWCVPHLININAELKQIKTAKRQVSTLKVGEYVAVDYGGDILNNVGRCRGLIVRLPNKNMKSVKVKLIDLGFEQEFDVDSIFELPTKFFNYKRLCFRFGLRRYTQIDTPKARAGVEEYLQKVFAVYTTGVRIDVQLAPDTFPSSETMHFGEIHCFSGEVCIAQDLILKQFVRAKIHPGNLRGLTYKRYEPAYINPGEDSEEICAPIQSIEEAIEQYLSNVGLTAYSPWMKDTAGELCLVKNPKSKEWSRGKIICIDGIKAWVKLVDSDSGRALTESVLQLKEMPRSLRDYLNRRDFFE